MIVQDLPAAGAGRPGRPGRPAPAPRRDPAPGAPPPSPASAARPTRAPDPPLAPAPQRTTAAWERRYRNAVVVGDLGAVVLAVGLVSLVSPTLAVGIRSEERRVGKECLL